MNAVDAIRTALNFSDDNLAALEDMADAPLTRPSADGGNHPMWIAGHLAFTEGRLHQILNGGENPLADWRPLFDWGSAPTDDAADYPPYAEVLDAFRDLRAKTYALLDGLDDTALDGPTKNPPPGMNGPFGTVGPVLLLVAGHQAMHCGQATVARRAAGKAPMFTPSPELRRF